jgi:hypothetical protein
MSETDLQRAILDGLERLGFWACRLNSGMKGRIRMAPKGTPDILVLAPYLWLEVKLPKEDLLPSQVAWHERAKRDGVPVVVVYSVDDAIKAVRGAVMLESRERYRTMQEALYRLTGRGV